MISQLTSAMQAKIGVGLFVLTILLFEVVFPKLDLRVSALFFEDTSCEVWARLNPDATRCGLFWLDHQLFYRWIRRILNPIPILAACCLVAALLAKFLNPSKVNLPSNTVILKGHLVSFFLGPMIMVNWVVKPLWGRSRPFQTIDFGGYENYTSVLRWGQECSGNCSFVSGEVASMAWLLLGIQTLPKHVRFVATMICAVLVLVVAYGRLAAGRHFISDIIFSLFLVFMCHLLGQLVSKNVNCP